LKNNQTGVNRCKTHPSNLSIYFKYLFKMNIIIWISIIALITSSLLIWLFYKGSPDDDDTQTKHKYGKEVDLFR